MWLRDLLPVDLSSVRVVVYGYDTRLIRSQSFQNIDDIALFFIRRLVSTRSAGQSRKPLILLAHSLGGIVLKSAITSMAKSGDYQQLILSDIKGAFFFGVPSRGMETSHLITMVESQPNQALIEDLSINSPYLTDLSVRFAGIALHYRVRLISAYETEKSPTVAVSLFFLHFRG